MTDKGVSPVISVLLLVAMAVSIAAVVYNLASMLASESRPSMPVEQYAKLRLVEAVVNGSSGIVYVLNTGLVDVDIDTLYIMDLATRSIVVVETYSPAVKVRPREIVGLQFDAAKLEVGRAYTFKVSGKVAYTRSSSSEEVLEVETTPFFASFQLKVVPQVVKVAPGTSSSGIVVVSPVSGYSCEVNLSVTSSVPDVHFAFSPDSGVPPFNSTLIVDALESALPSDYSVTVTGVGGDGQVRGVTFTLKVWDFDIVPTRPVVGIVPGFSNFTLLNVKSVNGYDKSVDLSCSSPPSVSCSLNPASGAVPYTSNMTIDLSGTANIGNYTVTVTGVGEDGRTRESQLVVMGWGFEVSSTPSERSLYMGKKCSFDVPVTPLNHYSNEVTLEASQPDPTIQVSFDNPQGFPPHTATMSVETSTSTSPGVYVVTVSGRGEEGFVNTTTVTIRVEYWKIGWRYRRVINVTEVASLDMKNISIPIYLDSSNFTFSHAQPDGSDLRFTYTNGTELTYYIEYWDSVNEEALIWLKIPSLPASSTLTIHMYYGNLTPVSSASDVRAKYTFYDDVESGQNGWQVVSELNGLWHITQHRYSSPTHSWYYGREGYWDYDVGTTRGYIASPDIYLVDAASATLTFATWWEHESYLWGDYDSMDVDVSTDGGATWTNVWHRDCNEGPSQADWHDETINLTPFVGHVVKIRFRFDSKDPLFNDYEGWYVDDIRVEKAPSSYPQVVMGGEEDYYADP